MRRLVLLGALVGLALAGCTPTPAAPAPSQAPAPAASGALTVEVVAAGLEHPWDVAFLPDGRLLVTERPGRLALVSGTEPGATVTHVQADLSGVEARGEGGLMGVTLHPAVPGEFFLCTNHNAGDVRIERWRLDGAGASRVGDVVTGLPANPSGRHSGCRMAIAGDGMLIVGTGDAARPAYPQSLQSLGGKTLRIDPATGEPPSDNPFASASGAQRYIYTYGHRNVQGVAVRSDGAVFTAEHGPDRDDEVNLLQPGANYGWDPQGSAFDGYDERVPMTDLERFPDAVPAVWSSGAPTEAIAGLAILEGTSWGDWDGALATVALKGSKLIILRMDGDRVADKLVPPEVDGQFGRLRAARVGPDGALYLTSSNGTDDKIIRVRRG